MEMTEAQDVIFSGLTRNFTSTNLFHNGDLEDKGRSEKRELTQFAVRLTQTPVRALPSWDESKQALVNPGSFEWLWHATYEQFGAVADLNEGLLQAQAEKSPPKQTKRSSTSAHFGPHSTQSIQ